RQGIPADLLPLETPLSEIEGNYAAIVISGSPSSSHQESAPHPDPLLWTSDLPVLGICYCMQSMVIDQGGQVEKNAIREDGRVVTNVDYLHPLFKGSKDTFTALFTHGDFVKQLPKGYTAIGQHVLSDGSIAYSAIAKGNKIGVQFHPEVFDDTPEGFQIFGNFLHGVAEMPIDERFREEELSKVIEQKRAAIADQVAGRDVIAFVSGGVDSSVAALLTSEVVPADKLHAFYIDNGFMRDEDDMVIDALQAAGINVTKIVATDQFEQGAKDIDGVVVGPLIDVTDPQTKRLIIGKVFVDVQNDILKSLNLLEGEALLLQGTNAADRIESGHSKAGSHTDTIKTHHNQVAEIQAMKARGLIIEPIDDLFKEEIRALGRELGLPHDLVERQPFPGPGLAIRIIAAAEDKAELEADPVEASIRNFVAGQKYETQKDVQVHVLPVRSVGVGGDERSHISVAAIDNAGLQFGDMARLATDIPAHFRANINRVVYALSEQPLAKRTVTKTLLTSESRDQLRHADRIVFEAMREFDLLAKIKQMPVVLLPISFDKPGDRSIVLRPVTTTTFLTAQALLPGRDYPAAFLGKITERLMREVTGISQVFLDLTNKPPGTTEWE
ncbi:MAG: hypothetical protein ABIV43_02250, partial [Candidatus Saccharimonadales bacterium]